VRTQTLREVDAPAVGSRRSRGERRGLRVALDNLVRHSHDRAPDLVTVEHDLHCLCPAMGCAGIGFRPSWPHGTGLKDLVGQPSRGR